MSFETPKLKNVLVIDDDDDYNFITELVFEDSKLDCNLVFKCYAQDALDYLNNNLDNFPDLILLDINMPIMNGWEFLDTYERLNYHKTKNAIIAMISSSVYQEDKNKAKTYSKVVKFIDKPITLENIFEIKEAYFS